MTLLNERWSGEDLKKWRKQRGYSQKSCAEYFKISKSTWIRYERKSGYIPYVLQLYILKVEWK